MAGGSSTSVHVAPHTDLYSRSHSLMHAVAVPKGVCRSCCRAAPLYPMLYMYCNPRTLTPTLTLNPKKYD